MRLLLAIAILATIAPAGAADPTKGRVTVQPDLNMDDLRTFSRRFVLKHQPLHPSIEDRRQSDTSMTVPHARVQWPKLPATDKPGRMQGTVTPGPFVPSAYAPRTGSWAIMPVPQIK